MTCGVVLPAYNVARHLPDLVAAMRREQPDVRILAVDDGSADDTVAVARTLGLELIEHPQNRGKGAALMTGFGWAGEQGIERVFTMDADGQHLPREMQAFLDVMDATGADIVVGSRMDQVGEMPWLRLMTNRFTSWVVSRLAGSRIPDSQNGFRLFRTSCLAGIRVRSTRFDFESEILVRLGRRGARIASVPITSVYGDERSSINPIVDTVRFFRLVLHLILTRNEGNGTPS